ncbi:cell differentiation protein rcd1-like [Pistacia vera]|uniref:cell differentiation protein rcd1-like n=1 Tax=Pistacia vera TaxID=55513 RepID=UPI001263A7B6|nr:cell differentiation protein rcd1-like [Pistacia vera]
MANLPESIWGDSLSVAGASTSTAVDAEKLASLEQWIKALQSHETRERALIVLSKMRENREHLAPLFGFIWYNCSAVTGRVATFIVHKILSNDEGLRYCCTFAERFFAVAHSLREMVEKVAEEPSQRLLKLIISCFFRLSENPRACDGLRCCLPRSLKDNTYFGLLQMRENRGHLAPLLWDSFGTIALLLQEIISVYVLLSSSALTERTSSRASHALALFQCVASHPDTRKKFLNAQVPLYLYPFLNNRNKEKSHEYLRLASLGVIGALVKSNDPEAINFLLETRIFPCCLVCMEVGTELSKTVATFIVHKILSNDEGLRYCCTFAERFFAVAHLLREMVEKVAEEPSQRLLKLIISCFFRLSENPRACDGLRCCLPRSLKDNTFFGLLQVCSLITFLLPVSYFEIS